MEIKILDYRLTLPEYATKGSAAFDLRACTAFGESIKPNEEIVIPVGDTVMVGCGISIDLGSYQCEEIADGSVTMAALILPRSGLGCKGLKPANSPGLIDADYQGQISVCLTNQGKNAASLFALDRIAQLLIVPVFKPEWKVVEEFSGFTERGEGGFGSTGLK